MNQIDKYLQPSNDSYLWGMFEGKRKAKVEEERRKSAALAAENELRIAKENSAIALTEKAAGITSKNDLEALATSASTQTYIILGVVLVLVVGLAAYFKFRK